MSTFHRGLLIAATITLAAGCGFNRSGVSELGAQQQAYYQKLSDTLKSGRSDLQKGLDAQLDANNWRRRKLNEWSRDLDRAEVLLRVDSNVSGNKRLLSYQLAQLDLQRVDVTSMRDESSARHVATIMRLYGDMQNAVAALQKNNQAITEYLGSGDREFVVRSIDIDGIVAAAAGIQDTRDQLGGIETRAGEERAEEREQIQKIVDRARNTLLRVFELNE